MAYASLLSLSQIIEQILCSHNQPRLFLDEEQLRLRSLHQKLCDLLSFLENSSPRNSETTNSYLEGRIRDAAYEAEDLVESHMASKLVSFDAAEYEAEGELHMASKSADAYEAEYLVESHDVARKLVIGCFQGVKSCYQKIIAMLQHCAMCFASTTTSQTVEETIEESIQNIITFEEKLQNIIEKLSSIWEEVEKMKANNNNEGLQLSKFDEASDQIIVEMDGSIEEAVLKVHPRNSLRASSSKPTSTDKSSMVGFENDMLQIKSILAGSSTKLEIISIVGMGGIGKTTLATNIYNDSLVMRHFDIRAWITISQKYDMTSLLSGLLGSMGEDTAQISGKDEQELKLKLYQSLKKRRYLIVLDDVWDVNLWDEFKRIFPDDDHGSRIIMTSRSSNVAGSNKSCSHIHRLDFLSHDQSWNLLQQKAFGKESCPRDLEDMGKRIAENCGGLALAIVAVGGVLHKIKKTPANWEYIAKHMKSSQTGNYHDLMEILSWSYNYLPHHLRACFLYMGVFPEDFVVHVPSLIMLWIANGFIKPVSSKTLEEVALEYLRDLINRNLIMVRKMGYCRGEIKAFVLHDLVRNMCIKKSQEEKFLLTDSLWFTFPGYSSNGWQVGIIDYLQISLSNLQRRHDMCKIMPFQQLKVFNAVKTTFEGFPIELIQLVKLRFIALTCVSMRKVPISLSKLRFLQTLLLFTRSYFGQAVIIPTEILKMKQLMHLVVERGELDDCSGGRMENLQTLRCITNCMFTKEMVAVFRNVKTLEVSYNSEESALGLCFENIVHLRQLECLKIHYYEYMFSEAKSLIDLSFPVKLRKLSLHHFSLPQRHLSSIGKLPNLEVLRLKWITLPNGWKTGEDEFGELKVLFIGIGHKFTLNWEGIHFPSLEYLTFEGIYHVDDLPSEIGEIPNLKVIDLYYCKPSVVASANKIREEQLEEWGNDTLKVHVHPNFSRGCYICPRMVPNN